MQEWKKTIRNLLICWGGVAGAIYWQEPFPLNTENLAVTAIIASVIYAPVNLLLRAKRRRRHPPDPLDRGLFTWPDGSPFTLRHMLRSCEVKGITGSGKSSGSGKFITEAIVRHPRSTCFIVAQKPEDKEFYQNIFKRHNKPLVVIEQGSEWRCNFLATEMAAGADTRSLVEFLTTLGEALDAGSGRAGDPFWKKLEERIIFAAVEALKLGTGTVDAPSLLKFISTAAYNSASLVDPKWRHKFHNRVMEAAFHREKTSIEAADYELIKDFWQNEFPHMDDKPRSSGLAGVMNTISVFNTGLVRDICSTTTTITPSAMEDGISVLVNYPFANYGPTGRFIVGGFKYMWQKQIMRRHWNPRDYFNVMIMDEYQESATELDAKYLAQCRSHGGCLFCLTQTIHSEYASMHGHGHHHRADQLLSNFGTHIYHSVDAETAKFASALLGQRRETFTSITPRAVEGMGDEIFGKAAASCSVSESYQPVLQPAVFMNGLRCGGPENDYMVDGIVIRGDRFANGQNWQFVSFPQK